MAIKLYSYVLGMSYNKTIALHEYILNVIITHYKSSLPLLELSCLSTTKMICLIISDGNRTERSAIQGVIG